MTRECLLDLKKNTYGMRRFGHVWAHSHAQPNKSGLQACRLFAFHFKVLCFLRVMSAFGGRCLPEAKAGSARVPACSTFRHLPARVVAFQRLFTPFGISLRFFEARCMLTCKFAQKALPLHTVVFILNNRNPRLVCLIPKLAPLFLLLSSNIMSRQAQQHTRSAGGRDLEEGRSLLDDGSMTTENQAEPGARNETAHASTSTAPASSASSQTRPQFQPHTEPYRGHPPMSVPNDIDQILDPEMVHTYGLVYYIDGNPVRMLPGDYAEFQQTRQGSCTRCWHTFQQTQLHRSFEHLWATCTEDRGAPLVRLATDPDTSCNCTCSGCGTTYQVTDESSHALELLRRSDQ